MTFALVDVALVVAVRDDSDKATNDSFSRLRCAFVQSSTSPPVEVSTCCSTPSDSAVNNSLVVEEVVLFCDADRN